MGYNSVTLLSIKTERIFFMPRGGSRPGSGSGGTRPGAGRPRHTEKQKRHALKRKRRTTRKRVARWRKHHSIKQCLKVYHRSQKDDWETPPAFFAQYDAEFHFTLDAAASPTNALCARYYTVDDDALLQCWTGTVWLNPPYGRQIYAWMEKAYLSSLAGATVVCLVPARTETIWWHTYVEGKAEIRRIQGRLKFSGAPNNAPFPSVLIIFRPPNLADLEVSNDTNTEIQT